jgi:TPR repeat protein
MLDLTHLNDNELKNYKKSEQYLLKAYEKLFDNDKELVAYNLGILYSTLKTPSSYKKACSYFEKTTIKEAYFNLGISYYNGQGVKENNKNGYEYFLKSANLGYERAQLNIVKMERLYPSLKK